MPDILYKVMNRCPRCQARDFAVRDVRKVTNDAMEYELLCACGNVVTLLRDNVKLAVVNKLRITLGYHHWTRGNILLSPGSYIDWDELQVA